MLKLRENGIGKIRAITISLFFCFVSCGVFYPIEISKTFGYNVTPAATPKPKAQVQKQAQTSRGGFPDFPHNVKAHKIPCSSCHKFPSANWKRVRKSAEAFPDVTDYPKHESCLKCHRQEFFGSAKPMICSICHINPGPRNGLRHSFPNPREIFDTTAKGKQHESDFDISFPHDKHIEIVSENRIRNATITNAFFSAAVQDEASEKSCSVCHQTFKPQGDSDDEFVLKPPVKLGDAFWLKRGTFKTVPISHAQCFTCHSADTGILPAPSTCSGCHKPEQKIKNVDFDAKLAAATGNLDKITLTAWRRRDSSATFRHEFSSHAEMQCATCHAVATMKTTDPSTKKVPVTSCNMCHITATTDDGGILNFEVDSRKNDAKFQCVKCHIAFGRQPIPDSHIKAIADAAGN